MIDPRREIQRDIYAALTGDILLMAAVTGVFDHVPQSQPYPFIKIGQHDYRGLESKSTTGYTGTLIIDTWDRPGSRGIAPLLDLQAHLRRILHDQVDIFNLTDFRVLDFREGFTTVVEDPDTVTQHGISQFEILTKGVCLL